MLVQTLLLTLTAVQGILAHPHHNHRRANTPEQDLGLLFEGNKQFRANIESSNSGLLKQLTDEGQSPPFMFMGCSDSRVSEGTVFNAKPGTLFTERNIANQFRSSDTNAYAIVSYAIAVLGVQHLVVMGHYGCGGVAAAIASPPAPPVDAANAVVQAWIAPIRDLMATSTRTEIVEMRERLKNQTVIEEPEVNDPGFRALVEENIKAGVASIAKTSAVRNHFNSLKLQEAGNNTKAREESVELRDIFVHGWVYDIENGEIKDLGISVGPPGKEIPAVPFAKLQSSTASSSSSEAAASSAPSAKPVANAAASMSHGGGGATVKARCEQKCGVKRRRLAGEWA